MLTGFFSGVSGMHYNEQKLDAVSNNIANADTTSFKRAITMFRSRQQNPQAGSVDRDVAKRHPRFYGIERGGIYKDMAQSGQLRQTGNPLDLAISPELKNAFFAVNRPGESNGKTFYTRNGQMSLGHLDPKDFDSPTVLYMGGNVALGADGAPISIDPTQGELKISEDGTLHQKSVAVGELALYRFDKSNDPKSRESANLQGLRLLGDSLYEIPEDFQNQFFAHQIKVGQAGVKSLVHQGVRESSNVNVFQELVEMMSSTKNAEANRTAMQKHAETLTKLFDVARS